MSRRKLKVYLDNCCYNRPYDDQSNLTVSLETQAKLFVQGQIRDGCLDMVSSYILDYENSCNPFANRRTSISSFLTLAETFVGADHAQHIQEYAEQIMETGVKEKDSLHVACAIFAKSDYFITTDYRLLKYKSDDIRIIDPIRFVLEYELRDSL